MSACSRRARRKVLEAMLSRSKDIRYLSKEVEQLLVSFGKFGPETGAAQRERQSNTIFRLRDNCLQRLIIIIMSYDKLYSGIIDTRKGRLNKDRLKLVSILEFENYNHCSKMSLLKSYVLCFLCILLITGFYLYAGKNFINILFHQIRARH